MLTHVLKQILSFSALLPADISYKAQSPRFLALWLHRSALFFAELKAEFALIPSEVACFDSKAG